MWRTIRPFATPPHRARTDAPPRMGVRRPTGPADAPLERVVAAGAKDEREKWEWKRGES